MALRLQVLADLYCDDPNTRFIKLYPTVLMQWPLTFINKVLLEYRDTHLFILFDIISLQWQCLIAVTEITELHGLNRFTLHFIKAYSRNPSIQDTKVKRLGNHFSWNTTCNAGPSLLVLTYYFSVFSLAMWSQDRGLSSSAGLLTSRWMTSISC